MANNTFQLKRSSVAGKQPNTSTLAIGELALNLTDQKIYSSNGTGIFEPAANVSTIYVGNSSFALTANSSTLNIPSSISVYANGSTGTTGQVLTTNGSSVFWNTVTTGGFTNGQSISVANFTVTGTVTANGETGSNGQVLASNGAGVYWATVSSGGFTLIDYGSIADSVSLNSVFDYGSIAA